MLMIPTPMFPFSSYTIRPQSELSFYPHWSMMMWFDPNLFYHQISCPSQTQSPASKTHISTVSLHTHTQHTNSLFTHFVPPQPHQIHIESHTIPYTISEHNIPTHSLKFIRSFRWAMKTSYTRALARLPAE